jgi:hypothetical protein
MSQNSLIILLHLFIGVLGFKYNGLMDIADIEEVSSDAWLFLNSVYF